MKAKKLLFLAASAPLLGSTQLFAQSTWIGEGTLETPALWSDSANWTGTVPTNGATVDLIFLNSTANSWSTNDLTGLTVSSINVPANDGAVTPINIKDNTIGGNAVTLAGNVTISTGNWQTFGFDMDLGAIRTFTVNTGQLTLSGNLSGAGAGIRKEGGGTLIVSGNNTIDALTRLTIASSCTVTLANPSALGTAGGSVSFGNWVNAALSIRTDTALNDCNLSGGSSGNAGTVTLGRQSNGAAYTQDFAVGDFGSRTMIFNQGSNVTSGRMTANIGEVKMTAGNNDRPMTLAGNARIVVGSASITANGNREKRLQLDGTDANNAVTGTITDTSNSTAGAIVSVIKANTSTWTLSGTNSYTGYTNITGGTLRLTKRASLYNGDDSQWLDTNIGVALGGTLALNVGGVDEFTSSDVSTLLTNLSSASVDGVTGVLYGLQDGAIMAFDTSNADGGIFTVSENFVDTTGDSGGALGLTKAGANTLILAGTNEYNGPTLITGGKLVTDYVSQNVRFTAGAPSSTNGVVELTSNASISYVDFASGSGNGGTIVLNRSGAGAGLDYQFGLLDLSSVTLTVNNGDQVTSGNSSATFSEVMMTGGNDNNPVTLAGDADITIGSASITNNGISKRLQLDGSSPNNVVTGVISDSNVAIVGAKVSLIKAGTSTWHLQGDNTYTGDTTILDGTLKLDYPCLDDASTVRITGTLELNHGSQDTVTSLFINGNEMPPGIYRSESNPGEGSQVPEITGTGTLLVLSGPSADDYDTWANTFTPAVGLPEEDDDGDGLSNFDEYSFGLDPQSGASANPVSQQLNKGTGQFKYTRRATPGSTGVTYTYESSLDLSSWPNFTPDAEVSDNASPVEEITVTVPAALLSNPKLFIRVKAVK